jgi:hypothetical protein
VHRNPLDALLALDLDNDDDVVDDYDDDDDTEIT